MFGIEIEPLIRAIGVLGIASIIFAESGLLAGFFLPGDTLLFAAGLMASQNVIGLNVNLLVLVLLVAAIAGNTVAYAFGKKVGRRIFKKPDALFFNHANLQRAEKFYEKYGPATVLFARFVPVVRTFAPVVAGVGNMRHAVFQTYNVIGGFLWIASVTYLGYFGGTWLEARGISVDTLVLPVILLAVIISTLSPIVHILRTKDGRAMFMRKLRIKR